MCFQLSVDVQLKQVWSIVNDLQMHYLVVRQIVGLHFESEN